MAEDMTEQSPMTDAAKAALLGSGVIPKLKNTLYADAAPKDNGTQALKTKAYAMAEDLQQLIDGGKLDDGDLQKLMGILAKLRGALQGGGISREALATALSEATAAIGTASGGKSPAAQKEEQLWQQVEQHNKTINDDFKTMHQSGISFDDELWEKHQRLLDYLQEHPRDIEKQKELNALDDLLLQQAEVQLGKHPEAKPAFDHAKQESEERHQVVDKDLSVIEKSIHKTDFDWGATPDLTLNDVIAQNIGQKNASKMNTRS